MRKLIVFFVMLVWFALPAIPVLSQELDTNLFTQYSPSSCLPPQECQPATPDDSYRFPNFFSGEYANLLLPHHTQADAPDLNAAFIMQLPRYDYDAAKNTHAPGDSVSFVAHIANRGNQSTGAFTYTWHIDDVLILNDMSPSLAPSETMTLTLNWTWQSGAHSVRVELDPDNAITELSEQNNAVEDHANALAVGFWVEQSVYDWFNENQITLGLGSVSWDDWAQRQLRVWNQMFADAVTPLTPEGIIDRVRLDKVTVVPDGALPPCATNFPATDDKTIDLQWGFPSESVGIASGHTCGALNYYFDHPDSLNIEYALMHELSHARYLIDLYGLNVYASAAQLSDSVNSTDSVLNVDRNIEDDSNFSIPVYLSVGGELILCQSKSENAFTDCSRGEDSTTPRTHSVGENVNLAVVRLQDGQGNLIQGSSDLPLVGFDDHLYYNRYPDDLMSGGRTYGQHSAYAWNRIAGQRATCGNYNSPCNIGEYLNDIPAHNIVVVHNLAGFPVSGARIEVYQAGSLSIWYGKTFDSLPDIVTFTDAQGQADLGAFPFGSGDSIIHQYGHSNALLLLKIISGDESVYQFFEVTQANEAYWSGLQDSATYTLTADLPVGEPLTQVFLPAILNATTPTQTLLALHFEDSFEGALGESGTATGVTFTVGYDGQGVLFNDNDVLSYAASGNINRAQGRLEFWISPLWNGNDGESYVFFEIGETWFNRMRIMKDGANNFRFMVWSADTEYGIAHNVSAWQANEWHHIEVTWRETTIALYIDGALINVETNVVLPSYLDSTLYIGSTSEGNTQAQAIVDEFAIYSQP